MQNNIRSKILPSSFHDNIIDNYHLQPLEEIYQSFKQNYETKKEFLTEKITLKVGQKYNIDYSNKFADEDYQLSQDKLSYDKQNLYFILKAEENLTQEQKEILQTLEETLFNNFTDAPKHIQVLLLDQDLILINIKENKLKLSKLKFEQKNYVGVMNDFKIKNDKENKINQKKLEEKIKALEIEQKEIKEKIANYNNGILESKVTIERRNNQYKKASKAELILQANLEQKGYKNGNNTFLDDQNKLDTNIEYLNKVLQKDLKTIKKEIYEEIYNKLGMQYRFDSNPSESSFLKGQPMISSKQVEIHSSIESEIRNIKIDQEDKIFKNILKDEININKEKLAEEHKKLNTRRRNLVIGTHTQNLQDRSQRKIEGQNI
jgi:hypothetical protein